MNAEIITRGLRYAVAIWVSLTQIVTAAPGAAPGVAEPVAVVTDIRGKAEFEKEGPGVDVTVLTEFSAGANVKLRADAKLVVLYPKSGDQYALTGPGLARFGSDAPQTIDGEAPQKLRGLKGRDGTPVGIRPLHLAPAAMVVVNGPGKPVPAVSMASTVTLDRQPVFRWKEVERGLEYQLILKDAGGSTLFSHQVKGGSIELPEQINLQDGESYIWSIGTRSGMGQNYLSVYSFKVGSESLRAMVDNYRPGDDAPTAEQVAFAAWLDQMGLRDAANAQWTRIADAGGPVPALRPMPAQ